MWGPFSCKVVVHWWIISWCCLEWLVLALHAFSVQIVEALALLGRCESCFDACRGTKEQRCCTFWTAGQLHALASPLSWYLSPLNGHVKTDRNTVLVRLAFTCNKSPALLFFILFNLCCIHCPNQIFEGQIFYQKHIFGIIILRLCIIWGHIWDWIGPFLFNLRSRR